jgi:GrpB-like predicted nucleotidyltransferase (UPF0157 family)
MKFLKASDYQEKVNSIFRILESELLELLPSICIEHIGSSSIPNAISKGDLDVFISVSLDSFLEVLEVIKSIGFEEKKGTLRTDELCMLVTDKFNDDVAVQLVVEGSEFENFIIFRDLLRMSPQLVEEYNDLKLASVGLSEDEYRMKKSKWIKGVIDNEK